MPMRIGSAINILQRVWRLPPRGVALVEFALAAPFLIILLVAMLDLGFGFYYALQVQGAAAAGAQWGSVHDFDQSGIQTAATSNSGTYLSGITATAGKVCVCTDNNLFKLSGTYVLATDSCNNTAGCSTTPTVFISVNTQYQYTPILPYPWAVTPITLKGQSYRRVK